MARRHAVGPADQLLRTALPLVPGLKAGSIEGGFFDLTITDLSYEMPGLTAGADRITLRLDRDALLSEPASPLQARDPAPARRTRLHIGCRPLRPVRPLRRYGPRHHAVYRLAHSLPKSRASTSPPTAQKVTLAYFGASAPPGSEARSTSSPFASARLRSYCPAPKTAEERAERDRKVAERRATEIKAKFEARKPRDHVRRDRAQQNVRRPLLRSRSSQRLPR